MKNCKKCNELIPNRVWINGKHIVLNKRVYCLKCSPYGKHNTKQLEKIDLTDKEVECTVCHKKYIVSRKKGNSSVRCNSCYTRERRRKIKQNAVDYKGGKCSKCGYDKCISALDFHHINETEKDFEISGNNLSWDKIKKELDKCIVVCKNCHCEIHTSKMVV